MTIINVSFRLDGLLYTPPSKTKSKASAQTGKPLNLLNHKINAIFSNRADNLGGSMSARHATLPPQRGVPLQGYPWFSPDKVIAVAPL